MGQRSPRVTKVETAPFASWMAAVPYSATVGTTLPVSCRMFPRSVLIDARGAWPPLVRRGVMMDLESYDAWERRGAELLTREGVAVKRWLAACLFACWIACQGEGLAAI